jgi:hypothetical protein
MSNISTSVFEELFCVILLVLKDVTNYDDYIDDLSSFLEDNSENHKPSQSTQTVINKEQCKSKKVKLKEEELELQCEWRDCDYRTSGLDDFVCHVSLHLPHLEVKVNEDQEGTGSVLFSLMLAHISFCSFLKYFRSI